MIADAAAGACPKCGRACPDGAQACPRCGLVYARWPGAAGGGATLDDLAAALWTAVEAAWGDGAAHERFVQHCAATGQLAAAGRRYRAVLDGDAAEPIAARMQQRIVVMASFALGPPPGAKPPRRSIARSPWFLVIVGLALAAGAIGGIVYAR